MWSDRRTPGGQSGFARSKHADGQHNIVETVPPQRRPKNLPSISQMIDQGSRQANGGNRQKRHLVIARYFGAYGFNRGKVILGATVCAFCSTFWIISGDGPLAFLARDALPWRACLVAVARGVRIPRDGHIASSSGFASARGRQRMSRRTSTLRARCKHEVDWP